MAYLTLLQTPIPDNEYHLCHFNSITTLILDHVTKQSLN